MKAVIVGIGGIAVLAGPACAQGDSPIEMRKGREGEVALASTAGCVVNSQKRKAAALLDMDPGLETGKALIELNRDAPMCMAAGSTAQTVVMRTPVVTWRGAIAEKLYIKEFQSPPAAHPLSDVPQPAWMSRLEFAPYAVAQCAAQRAPLAADRVARVRWHSAEEQVAVNALLPVLRECGHGRKISFDRVTIHGMVAEGLFRARGGIAGAEGKL